MMNQRLSVNYFHLPVAVFIVGITVITAAGSEHWLWPVTPGTILIPCSKFLEITNLKKSFYKLVWVCRKDKNSLWKQKIGMNKHGEVQLLNGIDSTESYCLYKNGILKRKNVTVADNLTECRCDVAVLSPIVFLEMYRSSYLLLVNKPQETERNYTRLHDDLDTCTSDTDQLDALQIGTTSIYSEEKFSKANSRTGIMSSTQDPYPERTQDMTSASHTTGGDLSRTTGGKRDNPEPWKTIAIILSTVIGVIGLIALILTAKFAYSKMRQSRRYDDPIVVFNNGPEECRSS